MLLLSRTWQPIIPIPAREAALRAVTEIAEEPLPPDAPAGLAEGEAGQALLLFYLNQAFPGRGYGAKALHLLERCSERVLAGEPGSRGVADLAGVAWLADHVLLDEGAGTADVRQVADRRVHERLLAASEAEDLGVVEGLTGLALYAVSRMPRPRASAAVAAAVRRLDQDFAAAPDIDARTAIGLTALLARTRALGLEGPATTWPTLAAPAPGSDPLAWDGDLGLAASRLVGAALAGAPAWREAALATARTLAARDVLSQDAGFRKGAPGVAHLFARLAHFTGDERLRQAAGCWFERAIELVQKPPRTAGLLGSHGAALALLSGLTTLEPAWDVVLALSA